MPTPTDLVTDLPADFEVFGQAVDTSMADLKGGTTGQILSKATNADMDFTWITNDVGDITAVTAGTGITGGGTSGAVTITNSMATAIDAKGDLIAGTGADTFARLPIGTNGAALIADSTAATGLKWSAGYRLQETIIYTSNGTFTKASYPNATAIIVQCVGGGGSGGTAATTAAGQVSCGMPGGGGAYARSLILLSALGATETVTVGAGGSGGSGGNSSLGSLVIAVGGIGGTNGNANTVPTSGDSTTLGGQASACTGDLKISGSNSTAAYQVNASFPLRPMPGNSQLSGVFGGGDIVAINGVDGVAGVGFGNGGVPGLNPQGQVVTRTGANGASGIVIVEVLS